MLDLTRSSIIQGPSISVSKVESRLYIDSEDIRTSGGFDKLVDIVHRDDVISSLKYGMDKFPNKNNVNLEFITNSKLLTDDAILFLIILHRNYGYYVELLGLTTIWTSIPWFDTNGDQDYLVRREPKIIVFTIMGTRTTWVFKSGE